MNSIFVTSNNIQTYITMPINLIACVVDHDGRPAIGANNDLLFKIKEDMSRFHELTTRSTSPLRKNVVVMGKKTWLSIPEAKRPLKGRINIVLTRCPGGCPTSVSGSTYYMTFPEFEEFYARTQANTWVIGGGEIYKMFLEHPKLRPDRVCLTEITKMANRVETPTVFMPPLGTSYILTSISDTHRDIETQAEYVFKEYSHDAAGRDNSE